MLRDNNLTFEPKLLKNTKETFNKLKNKFYFLYSKVISTRDIHKTINEMFYCDLDKDVVSRITDRIIPEIHSWQQRSLESIYLIIYVDGIRFKVRESSIYIEKSIYIIIGINLDGIKEILGFWKAESESAKEWLNIFNELKSRGVQDILLACCDNLKGISEAFKSAFTDVKIQKCLFIKLEIALVMWLVLICEILFQI